MKLTGDLKTAHHEGQHLYDELSNVCDAKSCRRESEDPRAPFEGSFARGTAATEQVTHSGERSAQEGERASGGHGRASRCSRVAQPLASRTN